jgi:hypothetical protein
MHTVTVVGTIVTGVGSIVLIMPCSSQCGCTDVPCVPSVILWLCRGRKVSSTSLGGGCLSPGLERGGSCLISSEAWLGLGQDGTTLISSETWLGLRQDITVLVLSEAWLGLKQDVLW